MADQVLRMQQEAQQRVQRMREHARRLVEEDEGRVRAAKTHPPRPPQPPSGGGRTAESLAAARPPQPRAQAACSPTAEVPEARQSCVPAESPAKSGGLSLLGGDQEQALLLFLALLLAKNGAQVELIVALLYLAM